MVLAYVVVDEEADMVVNQEADIVVDDVADMVVDEVADMVPAELANMEVFFRPELEQKNHLLPQIGFLSTGYRICIIYN